MARAILLAAACVAAMAAHSEGPAAALGKQRAAGSPLQWEIREAKHPVLGPVRFAFLTRPVSTVVATATVSSNVYVSCEKNRRRIAIELANGTGPSDPDGLKPAVVPRLVCHRPTGATMVHEELNASWEFNTLGDALSRGLGTFPLRECATIAIQQEVLLPEDWGIKSAKIAFEISPYARELDAIFATCGEASAYANESSLASTRRPAASPASQVKPARTGAAPWKSARIAANGKTPVRARPATGAALVTRLDRGDTVLVQQIPGNWWRAKGRKGAPFEGYIRRDRVRLE